MENVGYWLFLLIMYLLSGYKKKKKQEEARRQIESEDGWEDDSSSFTPQIQKWFKAQGWLGEEKPIIENNPDQPPIEPIIEEMDESIDSVFTPHEGFEDNIHSSNISKEKFIPKRKEETRFIDSFFKNKRQIQQAFILKEILDKPRAHRKAIR